MTNITATWETLDDETAEMVTAVLYDLLHAVRCGRVELTSPEKGWPVPPPDDKRGL